MEDRTMNGIMYIIIIIGIMYVIYILTIENKEQLHKINNSTNDTL